MTPPKAPRPRRWPTPTAPVVRVVTYRFAGPHEAVDAAVEALAQTAVHIEERELWRDPYVSHIPAVLHGLENPGRIGPSIAGHLFDGLLSKAVARRDPDAVPKYQAEKPTEDQIRQVLGTFRPHELRDVGQALATMTEMVDDLLGLSNTTTRTEKPR